jgi:hypothetical protein
MLGWTLLLSGLSAAGAGVTSWWWNVYWLRGSWGFELACGQVRCIRYSGGHLRPDAGAALIDEADRFIRWRAQTSPVPEFSPENAWNLAIASHHSRSTGSIATSSHWNFVLWPIPPLLCGAAGLFLHAGFIARRRAMTGMCFKCAYDLTGIAAEAKCPECGTPKPAPR